MNSISPAQKTILKGLLLSSLLAVGSALATGCVANPVTDTDKDASETSDAGKTMTSPPSEAGETSDSGKPVTKPSAEAGSDAGAPGFACSAGTKSYCSYQTGEKLAAQLQDNGSATALSFGSVPIGKTVIKELLIEDTSGKGGHFISGFTNLAAPFSIVDQGDCHAGDASTSFGQFCVIAVSFTPTSAQDYSQQLLTNWAESQTGGMYGQSCLDWQDCIYGGARSSSVFTLVGTGTTSTTLTPASYTNDFPSNLQMSSQTGLDFGIVQPGSKTSMYLLVTNTSSSTVQLSEITNTLFLFADTIFSLGTAGENDCSNFTSLPAGVTCTLTVLLNAPKTPGAYVSAATITDSVGTSVFATSVKLTATVAAPDAGADASN